MSIVPIPSLRCPSCRISIRARCPVVGVDAHLPPVPLDRAAGRTRLQRRFSAPPPVAARSRCWSRDFASARRPGCRCWCPLVHARVAPTVLLTQRTAHLSTPFGPDCLPGRQGRRRRRRRHGRRPARGAGGSRPGGGVRARSSGTLPVYVTGHAPSSSRPVVALVQPDYRLAAQRVRGGRCVRGAAGLSDEPGQPPPPCDRWEGVAARVVLHALHGRRRAERFIWGATAGMLRNFYRFLARLSSAVRTAACAIALGSL